MDWKRKAATLMMVFLPLASCGGGEPGNYSQDEIEDAIQKADIGTIDVINEPLNGHKDAARFTIGNFFKDSAAVLSSKQKSAKKDLKETCNGTLSHGYFAQPETGNLILWYVCV